MIDADITWRGPEILEGVQKAASERLGEAAQLLAEELARTVGVPYPPASLPGEAPHRRTGRGQRGIASLVGTGGEVYVGITADAWYMLALDRGTRRIAARPWVLPAIQRVRSRLVRILGGGR